MAAIAELLVYGYIRRICLSLKEPIPSNDVMRLFIEWLVDQFDRRYSHRNIHFETNARIWKVNTKQICYYATAVGRKIYRRGDKVHWRIRTRTKAIIVGIVCQKIVKRYEAKIGDFTNATYRGHGIALKGLTKYHARNSGNDGVFRYPHLFEFKQGLTSFTMELDLTGKLSNYGILGFASKEYSGIAFNDIKLHREYRLAIAFDDDADEHSVELLVVISGTNN